MRGNIYTVRSDGSELQRLLEPANEAYSAPAFSPDGGRLAYIVDRKRVVVVDASDISTVLSDIDLYLDRTPPTPIASDFSMGPVAVHWSPDGTMLLVTRQRLGGSGASDVLLMNVSGTELRSLLDAGTFIEATWWRDADGTPLVLVVAADASQTAVTYDLDGSAVGRGLPATATRSAVASLQHPDGSSALIRSALGSPEPFEPIEVEDAEGTSIVAGGCGATWSPDGERFAFYNGFGIALKDPDALPNDVELIVTNADLSIADDASGPREDLCAGLGISWSTNAAVPELGESVSLSVLSYRSFRSEDLGIEFDLPDSWEGGAGNMPYASCFGCLVIGPSGAAPPYGIAIFDTTRDFSGPECGNDFGGCPVMGSFGIRTLTDGEETMLTVAGLPAAQQRMFRQPPLGLTNETGETRNYRDVATAIDTPVGSDLIVLGFYREDDEVGELEVGLAYDALLASVVIVE